MADQKALVSIKKSNARDFYGFGDRPNGRQMGSINTYAFNATVELLNTHGV